MRQEYYSDCKTLTQSARIKIPLPENVVFTPNVSERRFFEAQKFCCLFSKSVALRESS